MNSNGLVILDGIDRYRVMDPLFECVRVILSYRGDVYSPSYIQGIAGSAFRIGGICPCAPTSSAAMETKDFIKLVGYEIEYLPFGERIDLERDAHKVINRVKDEIRARRPVIVWNAFTTLEWDVVCGFDEEKRQLIGRGSYVGLDEYTRADEKRMINDTPIFGALLIGKKTRELNMREAELATLREAVRHANSRKDVELLKGDKWVFLEGLQCYDRWVHDFAKSETKRGSGDSYCLGVYRSTHRAASEFMRELVPKYPEAAGCFKSAAESV